ncbi:deubiquitinase OTUD6B-like isoform X1 [Tubulanus polymorphus]|uniref:deubiquitinase OTUD6B-like isoform X1 n=1 Tax=Tubulanus polymorphus TaxID=672921 RepID=UPI003DA6413D
MAASAENIISMESEEDLLQKQRKEKKELQAIIQKIKHSVPKGDKKKKKESQAEVARLEAELDEKHEKELKCFTSSKIVKDLSEGLAELGTENGECKLEEKKKVSKAQKRRDKKAAKEKETEDNIKQAEIDNLLGARNLEAVQLVTILSGRNLMIHEIPSDGNCMYSAVEDQLRRLGVESSIEILRKQTADYLRANADDFMPFLTNPHTGDPFTQENYEAYCHDVESTTAWGGQLELKALSQVLRHPIEVVQADGPCIVIGDEHKKSVLILSYHRHIYGLGEHYNSVVAKPQESVNDGFT